MNLDFNQLIELYGWRGLVFGIIITIIASISKSKVVSGFFSKLNDVLLEWFLKRKSEDSVEGVHESDVLNHDLFNYIDFWTYSKIPTFQFSTEYRTVVFRKYLSVYLKCYKKGISEFIKSGNYKKMDQAELWKSFLSMINNIVWDYEREAKALGIPDIVISKMKEKNNDTIQLTIDLIRNVSNSAFYESPDNLLKVYSIMNIILSILENAISNSESICNSINGQLRGMKFNDSGREVTEP
jgi:hypothetical protein